MPIAVKPCVGRFNDEVLAALSSNKDRAQWASHTCEVCGLAVGAILDRGKWVPEQHWPSVKYQPRHPAGKKRGAAPDSRVSDSQLLKDDAVFASR